MNWKKLETFKNISKFKSFNHASKILNKSQSSFSRDIMSLEKDLGFKLFDRHMKNGIKLTKGNELLKLIKNFGNELLKLIKNFDNNLNVF
jgi:DNA-binding transcriptional LysR family regulator